MESSSSTVIKAAPIPIVMPTTKSKKVIWDNSFLPMILARKTNSRYTITV